MADVPPGVVTVTSSVPAPGGLAVVMVVLFTTVNAATEVPLNFTTVAPVNPVPEMVTDVPPLPGPVNGATLLTVGTGM